MGHDEWRGWCCCCCYSEEFQIHIGMKIALYLKCIDQQRWNIVNSQYAYFEVCWKASESNPVIN
jgi:hypothetical protein